MLNAMLTSNIYGYCEEPDLDSPQKNRAETHEQTPYFESRMFESESPEYEFDGYNGMSPILAQPTSGASGGASISAGAADNPTSGAGDDFLDFNPTDSADTYVTNKQTCIFIATKLYVFPSLASLCLHDGLGLLKYTHTHTHVHTRTHTHTHAHAHVPVHLRLFGCG